MLNINFPTNQFQISKGYKFCKQGIKNFKTTFVLDKDGQYINQDCQDLFDFDSNILNRDRKSVV